MVTLYRYHRYHCYHQASAIFKYFKEREDDIFFEGR